MNDSLIQIQLAERLDGVRPQGQPGPDFADLRSALEHGGRDADLPQGHGRRESPNAAADDQCLTRRRPVHDGPRFSMSRVADPTGRMPESKPGKRTRFPSVMIEPAAKLMSPSSMLHSCRENPMTVVARREFLGASTGLGLNLLSLLHAQA